MELTAPKDEKLFRATHVSEIAANADNENEVSLSFSSEQPYERSFGTEVLGHRDGEMVTDFIGNGSAPLLLDHNTEKQIGVVSSVKVAGGKGRATVRFSKSAHAQEILQDVKDGIRSNVSVGYSIEKLESQKSADGNEIVRATKWRPMEISFVSIPADPTVGVGRSNQNDNQKQEAENGQRNSMTQENKETTVAAQPVSATIDLSEVRNAARTEETKRVQEILALGNRFAASDLASQYVNDNKSVDEFRAVILDKVATRTNVDTGKTPVIGMSEREAKKFSLMRAINAASTNDWSNAGFEREASLAVAKRLGRSAQGFFVPADVLNTRGAMKTTVGSNIGEQLVATDHLGGSFIEGLYNKLVVKQAGATLLTGLQGNVEIPKLGTKATAAFVAENVAPSASSVGTSKLTLTPKTVAAYQDISRRLLIQSDPSVEAMVRNDMLTNIAVLIDSVALKGGGSNQPSGIMAGTPVARGGTTTDGRALSYADVLLYISTVQTNNAANGNLTFVTNPKVMSAAMQTLQSTADTASTWLTTAWDKLLGYPVIVSNQMPSDTTKGASGATLSSIIFGDFSQVIIGEWGVLDLLPDPYTGSNAGTLRLNAYFDVDVGIRHTESFSFSTDLVA